MTVKGINFRSYVFAGFVAAYLMFKVDALLRDTFGLFGLFPGTKDPWWMLEHHIDGILLALLFVWPAVYRRLPGARWLKGLTFGFLVWVVVTIVMAVSGPLGAALGVVRYASTVAFMLSFLLLHLTYGFVLGVLYIGPTESTQTAGEVRSIST